VLSAGAATATRTRAMELIAFNTVEMLQVKPEEVEREFAQEITCPFVQLSLTGGFCYQPVPVTHAPPRVCKKQKNVPEHGAPTPGPATKSVG